jgi:hypothetical protein
MNPEVHSEDIEGGCRQNDDHLVLCKSTTPGTFQSQDSFGDAERGFTSGSLTIKRFDFVIIVEHEPPRLDPRLVPFPDDFGFAPCDFYGAIMRMWAVATCFPVKVRACFFAIFGNFIL